MAFAERMWGDRFQVLVTTHLNTEHLHCHFVVNSVSFRDGKRLQNKEKAWWYFRHIADEVCLEHGLSVVQNPEAYQSPRILTQKDKAGMPTRYNLARAALDEAIAMSHNLRQLEYHLSEMGYTLGSNPKRKYWTIKGKGDERPIRLHRLGEEYTKERITQRLIENRDNIDFEPFQPKTYRPKQYRLRTRSDRIGKVGGLYGLYLYYCYRLGYLPKYKAGQQNHTRVHYLFKEDLMKIDELTKQVALLGKHHIGTDEQLFSYQHSVEEQIKTLTADRTHLRNEIRKVNITDAELSQAKASISLLGEKLKELRKEVKLCQDIAVRSKVILNRITQNRAKGKNTFIFIDEIYLLFQHEYSANFLFTLWKRVRKYGAYATGITQNVDDLLQSHTARTMLANSEFIVMLNQASTDRLELAKLLNISDTQLSYITNVDAGHGLIKVGSSLVPFANKFPKNTKLYKLMTTKPGEGA